MTVTSRHPRLIGSASTMLLASIVGHIFYNLAPSALASASFVHDRRHRHSSSIRPCERCISTKTVTSAYLQDGEMSAGSSSRSSTTPQNGQSRPSGPNELNSVGIFVDRVNQNEDEVPAARGGTLGDIMTSSTSDGDDDSTQQLLSGLVTTEGGTLGERFGIRHPLDRMALTANGNLQRLFSSYYDAPVHVVIDKCVYHPSADKWDRLVHLTVHGKTFCTARASVTVHDAASQELVQSGKVGLGQLFRHLDRLPTFHLRHAGYSQRQPSEKGKHCLWRVYELKCEEVTCLIREDFAADLWDICR